MTGKSKLVDLGELTRPRWPRCRSCGELVVHPAVVLQLMWRGSVIPRDLSPSLGSTAVQGRGPSACARHHADTGETSPNDDDLGLERDARPWFVTVIQVP